MHTFEVEGVGEGDALEGNVGAGALVVGVFDVERGDVVGEQHDFVTEQVVLVFFLQVAAVDVVLYQVDDKVACPRRGIEYLHPWLR